MRVGSGLSPQLSSFWQVGACGVQDRAWRRMGLDGEIVYYKQRSFVSRKLKHVFNKRLFFFFQKSISLRRFLFKSLRHV